jgi:hypothetical protein
LSLDCINQLVELRHKVLKALNFKALKLLSFKAFHSLDSVCQPSECSKTQFKPIQFLPLQLFADSVSGFAIADLKTLRGVRRLKGWVRSEHNKNLPEMDLWFHHEYISSPPFASNLPPACLSIFNKKKIPLQCLIYISLCCGRQCREFNWSAFYCNAEWKMALSGARRAIYHQQDVFKSDFASSARRKENYEVSSAQPKTGTLALKSFFKTTLFMSSALSPLLSSGGKACQVGIMFEDQKSIKFNSRLTPWKPYVNFISLEQLGPMQMVTQFPEKKLFFVFLRHVSLHKVMIKLFIYHFLCLRSNFFSSSSPLSASFVLALPDNRRKAKGANFHRPKVKIVM